MTVISPSEAEKLETTAGREASVVERLVICEGESFHEFSTHCNHRELISQTGLTGWHRCDLSLKNEKCRLEICERVKAISI